MNLPSQLLHYIDGQLCPSEANQWIDVYNPATGQVYAQLAAGQKEDVDLAVAAAARAKTVWANTPQEERCAILNRIADGIEKRFDEFAYAESYDNGKPIQLSKAMDIPRAISNFRFFANAIDRKSVV